MIVAEVQGVPVDDLVHRVAAAPKRTPEEVDAFLFGIGPLRLGDKRAFEPIEDEL